MSFQFVIEILKSVVDCIMVKVKFCVTVIGFLKVPSFGFQDTPWFLFCDVFNVGLHHMQFRVTVNIVNHFSMILIDICWLLLMT